MQPTTVLVVALLLHTFSATSATVNNETNEISRARILNDEGRIVYNGDKFAFICTGKHVDNQTDLGWQWQPASFKTSPKDITNQFFPPGMLPIDEDHSQTLVNTITKLVWSGIPKKASGTYYCYDNRNRNATVTSFHLNVTDAPPFERMKPHKTLTGTLPSGESLTIASEVVPSGSRFKLLCNTKPGNGTEWLLPPSEMYEDKDIYYENQVTHLWKRAMQYKDVETNQWAVEVRNASYLDTGLYVCIDKADNRTLSRHYVFVRDTKQSILPSVAKWVKTEDDEEKSVVVYVSQRHVPLGCGPTNPSLAVELRDSKNKQKLITSSDDGNSNAGADERFAFSPYQGFLLKTVTSWDVEGKYVCSTNQKLQQRNFYVRVIGLEVSAEHGQSELIESEKLVLTCKGKTIKGVPNLTWHWKPHHDGSPLQKQVLNAELLSSWNCTEERSEDFSDPRGAFFLSQIICDSTPLDAAGIFECRDLNDNSAPFGVYNLTVLEMTIPSIQDNSEKFNYIQVDSSGYVILPCIENGSRSSEITVSWHVMHHVALDGDYNATGEQLITDQREKLYLINTTHHSTELTVLGVFEDSTVYVCQFENQKGIARKQFFVQVREKPLQVEDMIAIGACSSLVLLGLLAVLFYVLYRRRKANDSSNLANLQQRSNRAADENGQRYVPFPRHHGNLELGRSSDTRQTQSSQTQTAM